MAHSVSKTTKPVKATELDVHGYNAFVASIRPTRIELTSLSAGATLSDIKEITVQVESHFFVSCPKHDESGFTAEARLELHFMAEPEAEVAHINCIYRLEYQADMLLSEGLLEQFASHNAPAHVWPFMRELVMNLTLRFGWTGFVMPSFLIPPTAAGISSEELAAPVNKSRKAAQSSKKT